MNGIVADFFEKHGCMTTTQFHNLHAGDLLCMTNDSVVGEDVWPTWMWAFSFGTLSHIPMPGTVMLVTKTAEAVTSAGTRRKVVSINLHFIATGGVSGTGTLTKSDNLWKLLQFIEPSVQTI